jgi:hypothetical protein
MRRLRKLAVWSALAAAIAAWREKYVRENDRRYRRPDR